MSDHKVEIIRSEWWIIGRWLIHIDWPVGPIDMTVTRWGAYRKARKMLKRMDGRQQRETYYVPRDEGVA